MGAEEQKPKSVKQMTDQEILDAVAGRVVRMQLAVPAVFFLESTKPLSFLGSQLLVFLQPFVQAFLSTHAYERFAHLMEDRENVEVLIRRVEELDEDARAQEKARKVEAKKRKAEEQASKRAEQARGGPGAPRS